MIEYEVSRSIRCRQIEAMFDVPPQDSKKLEWVGELPIEKKDWKIGLIVGPSGSGKSTIARNLFNKNYEPSLKWGKAAVIDDFDDKLSIEQISKVCSAVGFNTIPAWFRSYSVLSTGEKFRVEVARRMLELESPVIIDEFTSVIDRQVAKIGCHAVQKYIRRSEKQFIAISCHYDIIDWLQPDWIFEPASMEFKPRGLLRRPKIEGEIKRCEYGLWKIFAPYHYLTAELNKSARCYALFVESRPVAFAGVLHRPNWRKKGQNIKGISRIVTLPDWQGIGLSPILATTLGAAYRATGWRLRSYPAHPALIRVADKSKEWMMVKKPGYIQKINKKNINQKTSKSMRNVSRPGAVFEYCGPAMNKDDAIKLLDV